MASTPQGWTDVEDIYFKFLKHNNSLNYPDVHMHLDNTYATILPDLDALFEDGNKRTKLKKDVVDIIRTQIVEEIKSRATRTADRDLVATYVNKLPMISKMANNGQVNIRTENEIKRVLKNARNNNSKCSVIFLDIGELHFKQTTGPNDQFEPKCFEHISDKPFPATPRTNSNNTPPHPSGLTPQLQNALAALVGNTQASGGTTNNRGPQQQHPSSQAPPNVAHLFNATILPPDVADRYSSRYTKPRVLTGSEIGTPFNTTVPTTRDPNVMRTALYHLDPPVSGDRVICRDGSFFQLREHDASNDKQFIANLPTCPGPNAVDLRSWYYSVMVHASSYGIYVHPYTCFRREANHPNGFTLGDDTDTVQYDLPIKFSPLIHKWNNMIYTALSSDKIFSKTSCPNQRAIIHDHYGNRGYQALYAIIRKTHPINIKFAYDMIRSPPTQKPQESISRYYNRYTDFLTLRAFLANNPADLNNSNELDCFIGGTTHAADFRHLMREDRRSTDPLIAQKFTQGQIVGTLETLEQELPENAKRGTPTRSAKAIGRIKLLSKFPKSPKTAPVNKLEFDASDPLASLLVPNEASAWAGPYIEGYTVAAVNVETDPRSFDTSKPCAVCKQTGHNFDGCPVLNNINFLKQHYIQWKLFLARLDRSKADATVSQLEAEAIEFDDDDMVDEEDFIEGRD